MLGTGHTASATPEREPVADLGGKTHTNNTSSRGWLIVATVKGRKTKEKEIENERERTAKNLQCFIEHFSSV